ncbi:MULTISPECIES: extracellular solute-binding protein [Pseudovibrio]|uniref:extracellular solute-binding protein n=1 Tax=Stappiaceae TaxID=2821832 RepID=UPI0023664CBB|nr:MULTISPECIES: extracellular solute-binding protein [Pseudovibrio]MDD7911582.1 extracellular solute-binding protein [Pseudovibrio exalbescens]MDX5594317.1 extracellular solute-binding protein [Pseudovibrio sp. SPO723]
MKTLGITAAIGALLMTTAASASNLTVYSAHGDEIFGPLVSAFEEKHPEIDVEVIVGDTGALFQRVQAEAANPAADIQWGGAIQSFEAFAELYEAYDSQEAAALRLRDPNNKWFPFSLFAQPLLVNTDLVAEGDYPTTVKEVLDPRWNDTRGLVLADPNHSGTGVSIVSGLASGLGWEFMTDVIKTARATPGSTPMFEAVRDGEAAIGWINEDLGAKWEAEGLPVKMVYPTDGVTVQVDGLAIIANAPNADNAKTFIDFILSKEGQTLSTALVNRRSVRTDVTPPEGLPALDALKLFPAEEPADVIKAKFTAILEAK